MTGRQAEAVKMAERKKEEERQKALEEEKKKETLLAAQSRSYEDVCREAADVMKKTGDFEKASAVYGGRKRLFPPPPSRPGCPCVGK